MTPEAAAALVAEATDRLWRPEGAEALAYLTGRRLLRPETIRAARLGWTPRAEGVPWSPPGLVIPWYDPAGRLTLVKLRPIDGWRSRFPKLRRPPKHIEAFRDRPTLYPGPEAIRPGHPLAIVEGELESLLLGQEARGLVGVTTLGSAGDCGRPSPSTLGSMLSAWPWFIAFDADNAGDRAAAAWGAFCPEARRVRPPAPYKDWTEAAVGPVGARGAGVDLARWWREVLAGRSDPPAYTFADLAGWRWGPALDDPTPGIVVGRLEPT
jgi:hypothetical protein